MSSKITGLQDLRPGDLYFGPIGGLVPGFFPVGVGQFLLGEVFRAGRLSVRHVGVIVEARTQKLSRNDGPRMVQAMPGGAEEIELNAADHWNDRCAYVRLPEDYPGQAEDAAAIARLMVEVGTPYSFASYGALALRKWGVRVDRLDRWINRRRERILTPLPSGKGFEHDGRRGDLASINLPREAICSVLADQAWTLAGKDVMPNTAEQAVTPGALALQLWCAPGVVWGGAGMVESK